VFFPTLKAKSDLESLRNLIDALGRERTTPRPRRRRSS